MKKEIYYIYRYFNKQNIVIYVGLTSRPIIQRVKEHTTEDLQKETYRIDFAKVKTAADMRMYELYYINKYTPKFNTRDLYVDNNTVNLPELTFQPYLDKDHIFADYIETTADKRTYRYETKGGSCMLSVDDPVGTSKHEYVNLSSTGTLKLSKEALEALIDQLQSALTEFE